MTFIFRPIWLGADLTWGRFELGPIWLGPIWLEPIWLGADLTGKRPNMCLYRLSSVLWCPLWNPDNKQCLVRLYPHLFVEGLMSYLCYLCLLRIVVARYDNVTLGNWSTSGMRVTLSYLSGGQHVMIIWVTWRVFYKRQELLILSEHPSPSQFFWWGQCCLFLKFFVLFYYVSLCFEFRVVMSVMISA
jgi:hypothetical protein